MMKTLLAGAALALFAASGSAHAAQSSSMVGPKQPIPYAKLDAYTKASPRARANIDWWAGSATASTGMSTDTAATTSSMSSSSTTSANAQPTPSADGSGNSVNNAMGASQFQGAASTTTTGATPAQPAPKSREVHN